MAYAHSKNARGHRHDLVDHSRSVAELAAAFALDLQASQVAHVLGLWHDLGKFHPAWQAYLLGSESDPGMRGHGPDHKTAGAQLALKHLGTLALLVQGHHGGLQTPTDLKAWLSDPTRAAAIREALDLARQALPDLEPRQQLPLPAPVRRERLTAELFMRLLFSALVDADFLDTERHFREEASAQRGTEVTLAVLWERFERHQRQFSGQRSGVISRSRHEILEHCLAAAELPPGLFRLAVPTGGGKTLSAMGFALKHALRHGHRRVIVAVPFISITEQTADVYRSIFDGPRDDSPNDQSVVLEHHSGADSIEDQASGEEDARPSTSWRRLAAENWDAPIIVTTTVQLFQSLFAARTSATRKLHRIARSVIILDEAQSLPSHLLTPILDVLCQLCQHFGTTVVLSTATQPAFDAIPVFSAAPAREMVPDAPRFFEILKRVEYQWRLDPPLTWTAVAELADGEPQALIVVNTKKDALALLDVLDDAWPSPS